jgi:cell division protein ZapA
MENKLSIKLNIGNRQYPLSINRDEEEQIRKAATLINERIRHFKDNYAVRDMQDLVAMAALHFATADHIRDGEPGSVDMQEEKAAEIDLLLTEYLDKL